MEEPSRSCRQNSIGRWEDRGPPDWELQIINLQDEGFVYSRWWRDDMPIADFTAAYSSRRFGPQEVPHKQKYHNLGFSSVILADVTNVGNPRLVTPVHIAHATFSIGLFV